MAIRTIGGSAAAGAVTEPGAGAFRDRPVYERMASLLREAPVVPLTDESRVVVFSDLHVGDGGRSDDFRVGPGDYSPGPPTVPDVPISGIRFFWSWFRVIDGVNHSR